VGVFLDNSTGNGYNRSIKQTIGKKMVKDIEVVLTAVGAVVLVFLPGIATAIWFICTHA
jgi:hypothetical protein